MPDLFTTAAAWLDQQLRTAGANREIVIANAASNPTVSLTVQATPAESQWDEFLANGSVVRIASRDWIVTAADLITDDGFEAPHRGWIITDSLDDTRYEVIAQGDTPWNWSGSGHVRLRIHSQSIDRRN